MTQQKQTAQEKSKLKRKT